MSAELDLDALIDQRREALGTSDDEGDQQAFTFAGTRYLVPHPLFADEEWKQDLAECRGDIEFAQHVLGDQYDTFIAAGGKSSYIGVLWLELTRQLRDVDGQGRPTRSAISSRAQRRQQRPISKRTTGKTR